MILFFICDIQIQALKVSLLNSLNLMPLESIVALGDIYDNLED